MLLHLFDDEKIVNRTIVNFEKVFPQGNIFICFSNDYPKYVGQHSNLYFYRNDNSFDLSILKTVTKVIVHFLNYPKILFIERFIPKVIPCYWVIWGGDLYNGFLKNKGYELYYKPDSFVSFFCPLNIRQFLFNILKKPYIEYKSLLFIKKRVTHFVTDTDFAIAQKYIGKYIKGVQVKGFMYYPIDVILGKLINARASGNIIWIGNSASFTNNHLYAFEYLSHLNVSGKKILTPLSYGGTNKYINHIEKEGQKKWGDSYQSITKYLFLDKYNELMSSAEIFIFPSWRQEAVGNILVALYLGAKVFLSKRSTLVEYFHNMGVKIFILEDISQTDIDTPLSSEIIEQNRTILYDLFKEESMLKSIKQIWQEYNI